MPFLINPAGKITEVNTPEEFEYWKSQPGFRIPTVEVVSRWQKERARMIWEANHKEETIELAKSGLYFATVSAGGADGYGIASKMLIHELEELGIKTTRQYMKQSVGLLFHNPYSILSLQTPFKIIYTMFESDKIPDDWISYLKAAHMVLVPSKWCQEVFKKAGIESRVVPLGYDQETFKFIERKPKREQRKDFIFLHYNAFNIRKGFLEVFNAFNKAFEKDEPVKLVLKTTVDRPYQRFPIHKEQYPKIEILEGKYSQQQLADLMRVSDCFVFPSRGEGFGMTPLECMATGMPAIVPNAHGISEYFNPEYMYEAKVEGYCPALYSRYKNQDVGRMVKCDVDHLASQMRYIYEHQEEAIEKGRQASEYVKQWTFKNTALEIKKIFDEIKSKPLPKIPVIDVLPLKVV